jgi:phage antirepressor YoqD-like protein
MKKIEIKKMNCMDVTFSIREVAELLKTDIQTIERLLVENGVMEVDSMLKLKPTPEYKEFFKRKSKKVNNSNMWIFSHYEMNNDIKEFLKLIL